MHSNSNSGGYGQMEQRDVGACGGYQQQASTDLYYGGGTPASIGQAEAKARDDNGIHARVERISSKLHVLHDCLTELGNSLAPFTKQDQPSPGIGPSNNCEKERSPGSAHAASLNELEALVNNAICRVNHLKYGMDH